MTTADVRKVLAARGSLPQFIAALTPLYTRVHEINTAINHPEGLGIAELAEARAAVARITSELATARDENAPADAPYVGHLRERQRALATDLTAAEQAVANSNVWDEVADLAIVAQVGMVFPAPPADTASEGKREKYNRLREMVARNRAEVEIEHDNPLTWRELRVAVVRLLALTFSAKAGVAALLTFTCSEAGNGRLDGRNVSALKGCLPEMNEMSEGLLDGVQRYSALLADINDAIASLTAGQGAKVDDIRTEQSEVLRDIEAAVQGREHALTAATTTADGIADGLRKERTRLLADAHPLQEGVDDDRATLSHDEFTSIIDAAGLTDDVRRMIMRESDGD